MKRAYWIIIGVVLIVTIAATVWEERIRSRSQDVTIVEFVMPRPKQAYKELIFHRALNDQLKSHGLGPVVFFQSFEGAYPKGQFVSGNISYDRISGARIKLDQLSQKNPEITLNPIFKGRVRLDRAVEFRDGSSFELIYGKNPTPIEAKVTLNPENASLPAHFYDGHTIMFGEPVGNDFRVLFITVINLPESPLMRALSYLTEIFE